MALFTENYQEEMMHILKDMAHVRISGTKEEADCAIYLQECCKKMGFETRLEAFQVEMCDIHEAVLTVDGKEIPCKGYRCAGSGTVEAPFYYMPNTDACSLAQCKGKIVMLDGGVGYWGYRDLIENGAVGIITYDGNANYADEDIDLRELRSFVREGSDNKKIPCVNINAKSAIKLVNQNAANAKIVLNQDEWIGDSHNVILDLPGETDEMIVLSAHYDSTPLSQCVYDNMSGSVGLLGIADYFRQHPHHYSLRFLWCGSEERGLLGSKAYVAAHEEDLKKTVLNINLDMIGCIMGKFIACCTSEEKLVHYIEYLASETGFGMAARQGVYSSDSTPFADKGIPAVSFARIASGNTATIHNRYDTMDVMKAEHMAKDVAFITAFTEHMACAKHCPVSKEIPENMKEKLDIYLNRKRDNTSH